MAQLEEVVGKVIAGDWKEIAAMTKDVLDSGVKPEEVIRRLQGGMEVVGEKYTTGEYFLPDMMKSARCMNLAFEVLRSAMKGVTDSDGWLLATVDGGIDKMKIRQRQTKSGLKTTIEFTSLGGGLLTDNYDRVKRRRETAAHRLEAAKAIPG